MPLFSIYSLALEQDQEQSVGLQLANATLHNQTFIQVELRLPLSLRRDCSSPPSDLSPAFAASGSASQGARKETQGDQGALDTSQEKTGELISARRRPKSISSRRRRMRLKVQLSACF